MTTELTVPMQVEATLEALMRVIDAADFGYTTLDPEEANVFLLERMAVMRSTVYSCVAALKEDRATTPTPNKTEH